MVCKRKGFFFGKFIQKYLILPYVFAYRGSLGDSLNPGTEYTLLSGWDLTLGIGRAYLTMGTSSCSTKTPLVPAAPVQLWASHTRYAESHYVQT